MAGVVTVCVCAVLLFLDALSFAWGASLPVEPAGDLTLEKAFELVGRSPGTKVAGIDVEIAEVRVRQASRLPDQALSLEAENVLGRGQLGGVDAAEFTVQVVQPFQPGGRRGKQINLARLDSRLAQLDYESMRLDLEAEAERRFVDVLYAQERQVLAGELCHLAGEAFRQVAERVKAGKVSPVEEAKARMALSRQDIELERANGELKTARVRLSTIWGNSEPGFARAVGDLYSMPAVPEPVALSSVVDRNPAVVRRTVEIEQCRAALAVERAARVPDMEVAAGLRYFNETDSEAFVVGLSVPLPVFDGNRGRVSEAALAVSRAESELCLARQYAVSALQEAYNAYAVASNSVLVLKGDVLPRAQAVFSAAMTGFSEGRFPYLEVLDAQRTLFEARAEYLDAVVACRRAAVDIVRHSGGRAGNARSM